MRVRGWCLVAGVLREEIMGWLSINSPTIERLIGGRSRSSGKVKQSQAEAFPSLSLPLSPIPALSLKPTLQLVLR